MYEAGMFSWLSWDNLWQILFAIVILYAGGMTWKYRELKEEFVEGLEVIKRAIDPKGPGGKNITVQEGQAIVKEWLDVALIALKIYFKFPMLSFLKRKPKEVVALKKIRVDKRRQWIPKK